MKEKKSRKLKKTTERNKALSALQRLRVYEESANGYAKCISCGAVYPVDKLQGGHYIPRGYKITELEPDNINPQCTKCNCYYEGNIVNYRVNLIEKIGLERVERLENLMKASLGSNEAYNALSYEDRMKVGIKKTADEYHEQYLEYSKKLKEYKEI